MKASDIPTKFPIAFAASAGGSFIRPIPVDSQISITPGAASLTTGFPPVTFLPVNAGGVRPFGQDFNGILNQATAWSRWQNAGAPVTYDSSFSASINGYPKGAIVGSTTIPGLYWASTADDNTTNPESGGTNWIAFGAKGNPILSVSGSVTYTLPQSGSSVLVRSNAGVSMFDTLPGSSPGFLPNGTIVTVLNADTLALLVISPGAGANIPGVNFSGMFVQPGEVATFISDGAGTYYSLGSQTLRFIQNSNPTVSATANGGSMTQGSKSTRVRFSGSLTFIQGNIGITNIGTASGALTIALPSVPFYQTCLNARNTATGVACNVLLTNGSATAQITRYDGAFPVANGQNIAFNGFYESQM